MKHKTWPLYLLIAALCVSLLLNNAGDERRDERLAEVEQLVASQTELLDTQTSLLAEAVDLLVAVSEGQNEP